jgi:aspartyl-tRNA(Asn)/glutamyl-tRNA(Gln) amidotransferase subunit A
MLTLAQLASELQSSRLSARALIEECLQHIEQPDGQGSTTFLKVHAPAARAQARAIDQMRAAGVQLPLLAGVPVSVKDLFDVAGEVTTAGSTVLRSRPPAASDARVVARLRAAGCILVGRTNMTEFAYSGLGLNPHYGTPLNPFERGRGRAPGGSSSGAAISVTDGMAAAGIGTDTGGSCRIPAAMSGIVGFKPTMSRIPREGVLPLSSTLDSVGPLARSVECCALLDAVMSGADPVAPPARTLRGLRLLLPESLVLDDLDAHVAATFERCLGALSGSGVSITRRALPELLELPKINAKGGFSAAESYARYRELVDNRTAEFDPRVLVRIVKGREQSAADYLDLVCARAELSRRIAATTCAFDALVMPTVPQVAPLLSELASDEAYVRANGLALRNPAIANFLDGCAISLPAQRADEAPVGLMLIAAGGMDRQLFSMARAVENLLAPATSAVN